MDENTQIFDLSPLIMSQVKIFKPKNKNEIDEYMQAGRIGLLKAIRKFDPTKKKCKFTTYAVKCIRREIIRYIKGEARYYIPSCNIDSAYVNTAVPLSDFIPTSITDMEKNILTSRIVNRETFSEIGQRYQKTKQWAFLQYQKIIQKIRESYES